MSDLLIHVAGEDLILLSEGAVYWKRQSMLLVADVHFGKASAFRALGVPVPRGTTTGTISRLDAGIGRTAPRHVVFLGDFFHAAEGRAPETLRVLHDWRRRHAPIAMTLIRGNHDTRAGDPPPSLDIDCVAAPLLHAPFVLDHHPRCHDQGYVLCGHIHPAVHLRGPGRQRSRLPCFWFGPRIGVLPAFGEFTGAAVVDVQSGDRVYVLTEDAVVPVPVVGIPQMGDRSPHL